MSVADAPARGPAWKSLLAFATIYLVWGSTFYAIRVGVEEVPPFLLAALRFLVAGGALYAWLLLRGVRPPTWREWKSTFVIAFLIFVLDYGVLFWAERRVPSGIAAVVVGTIPAFTALSEIVLLGTQRLGVRLAAALAIGFGGVAVLTVPSHLGGEPVDPAGAVALLFCAVAWSIAAALSRRLPLPSSKVMSAASQMLAGGVMLAFAASALGEWPAFHPAAVSRAAWIALAYLVVAGSIVAFTAYTWLLHHHSPTKVGTYAYVNPVIAVLIGYFLGGEPLGPRTIVGTMLVLGGVIAIATMPARARASG